MATPVYQSVGSSSVLQRTANSTANATCTINKPSGVVVGDLLIAIVATQGDSGQSTGPASIPSGWSIVGSFSWGSGNTTGIGMYQKIATGSEPSTYDFIWTVTSNSNVTAGLILRITNPAVTPVDSSAGASWIGFGTTATYANTITTTLANDLLIFAHASVIDFSGGSPAFNGYAITTNNPTWANLNTISATINSSTAYFSLNFATATKSLAGATGNSTVNSSAGNFTNTQGFIVALQRNQLITAIGSDTETTTDTITLARKRQAIGSDTEIVTDASTTTKSHAWTNQSKHSSSWTDQIKHS